ncbi:PAS domain S-box protein [Undibacterium sp.]|jgi:PAS domain S-box-containing protein|uniref:sensor histidine kinase n=1 Tax=Undibacterium sp. TaxID=1914977 RepID=UPI002C7A1F1B|nr:PAS domain S-box protein [Undibacterium sp.]HTD05835.1 PAS domain S-box protein [Undibacterium sp.]
MNLSNLSRPPQSLSATRQDDTRALGESIGLRETSEQAEDEVMQNGTFTQAILNSIAASVVVLDRDGTIVAVNESWRRFGLETEMESGKLVPGTEVGANYFAANGIGCCVEASAGIHAVLTGHSPNFSVEYPCHSPLQQRWFRVNAMPLGQLARAGVVITHTDITERKLAEDKLRIVAIATECQDGILVMDANLKILWVNRAFTQITGFPEQEAVGRTIAILRKNLRPASLYEGVWKEIERAGTWKGETVWQRQESGEEYHVRITLTKVQDKPAQVTHYVGHFTDTTLSQQQEAQRLFNEAAYRKTLVREVHHRIKNNLQGITGILRQFAEQYPETTEPINQAIGQVKSISVIHGLLGRAVASSVRLCELTGAIAEEIQDLWQTQIVMDIPHAWLPCVIAEEEAVPIALVLNELILNAVKHGGKAHGNVEITLRKGAGAGVVQLKIVNSGQLLRDQRQSGTLHNGLQLVEALMPRVGASISRDQLGDLVVTMVQLEPPVIFPELETST